MTGEMRHETFEVSINATPEDVWRALTTGDGLAAWIVLSATVKPGPGGEIFLSWGPGQEGTARILEWVPGERLVLDERGASDEAGGSEGPGDQTLPASFQEWTIVRDGTATVVRLVHSIWDAGSDDWEADYDDFRRGWTLFLALLRHALEVEPGRTRASTLVMVDVPDDHDSAWSRLATRLSLPESLEPGTTIGFGPDREQAGVLVEFPRRSALLHFADGATLLLDLEGGQQHRWLYCLASTFGADTPAAATRRLQLTELIQEAAAA